MRVLYGETPLTRDHVISKFSDGWSKFFGNGEEFIGKLVHAEAGHGGDRSPDLRKAVFLKVDEDSGETTETICDTDVNIIQLVPEPGWFNIKMNAGHLAGAAFTLRDSRSSCSSLSTHRATVWSAPEDVSIEKVLRFAWIDNYVSLPEAISTVTMYPVRSVALSRNLALYVSAQGNGDYDVSIRYMDTPIAKLVRGKFRPVKDSLEDEWNELVATEIKL